MEMFVRCCEIGWLILLFAGDEMERTGVDDVGNLGKEI